MRKEFKKGEKTSIEWRFKERKRLLKPFIKKYGKPVLVHSTTNLAKFEQILNEGKLKFPKETESSKKNSFVEKILGIDKGIFFSLGFVYATAYEFKYSLIFDLELTKDLIYYRNSIAYQCYKSIADYWDKNDKQMLVKLSQKNKLCKSVVDKYYNEKYHGKTKSLFDFWKCEEELYSLIKNYPKKKELLKIISKINSNTLKRYPSSKRIAIKDYFTERVPEIISKKEINLVNNKNFLGFYIKGDIPKSIMKIIKEKYPDKIIFDGEIIK